VPTNPRVFLLCGLILAAGCASVPEESIELSATVGRDLAAVHTANRNLAVLHFNSLLAEVDRFANEVYRPYIIEATVEDLDLVAQFQTALAGNHELALDPLEVLGIYSEEVVAQIDVFRREMRAPLEAQRDSVVSSIDQAFQQLQTANAVVTGHLASIAKVHDAQAELLADVGLEDYQQKVATGLANLSADLAHALAVARDVDQEVSDIEDLVERVRVRGDHLKRLPETISALARGSADDSGAGGREP